MLRFPKPDLPEFYRTYAIGAIAVNKDESRIAFATNLSGKFNVWGMDLPNTYPYPLTHQDQLPAFIKFDPKNRYILVGFDQDGDENTQIYAVSPTGGALVPIRLADGRRHYFGALSEDGERLYYTSDKENHNFMNIYRYDLETDHEDVLLEGSGSMTEFAALAPDESSFVYIKAFSNTYALAVLHKDGQSVCLTPDPAAVHAVSWVTYLDADTVLLATNYDANYFYLAKYDIPTGVFDRVFEPNHREVSTAAVHRESGTVYCVASHGVEDELYIGNLAAKSFTRLEYPGSIVREIQAGESGAVYLVCTQENQPANLYLRDASGGH